MKRFCSNCGAPVDAGDSYCSACGHDISDLRSGRSTVVLVAAGLLVGAGVVVALVALSSAGEGASEVLSSSTTRASTTLTVSSVTTTPVSTTVGDFEMTASEIGSLLGDAVWRVESEGCEYAASGSSFAISANHLVTNQHVIENDSNPSLVSRDGRRLQGQVLGASPLPDVAIIEVSGDLGTPLEWALPESVTLGDPIVTLGYPAPDGDFTVTPGNVLSFGTEDGSGKFIRTDGQIDHGNSGGPSLDTRGGVVGIVTSLEANPSGAQLVPQIFSTDVVRPVVDAILDSPTYPESFCESTAAAPPESQYTDFWTGIIASLPVIEYDYDMAYGRAVDFYGATGLWADVLLSDLYYTLNPGYWAVYTGYFLSRDEADSHCALVESYGYDCYARQVSYFGE